MLPLHCHSITPLSLCLSVSDSVVHIGSRLSSAPLCSSLSASRDCSCQRVRPIIKADCRWLFQNQTCMLFISEMSNYQVCLDPAVEREFLTYTNTPRAFSVWMYSTLSAGTPAGTWHNNIACVQNTVWPFPLTIITRWRTFTVFWIMSSCVSFPLRKNQRLQFFKWPLGSVSKNESILVYYLALNLYIIEGWSSLTDRYESVHLPQAPKSWLAPFAYFSSELQNCSPEICG